MIWSYHIITWIIMSKLEIHSAPSDCQVCPIWIFANSMDLARKPLLCKWPQKPTLSIIPSHHTMTLWKLEGFNHQISWPSSRHWRSPTAYAPSAVQRQQKGSKSNPSFLFDMFQTSIRYTLKRYWQVPYIAWECALMYFSSFSIKSSLSRSVACQVWV